MERLTERRHTITSAISTLETKEKRFVVYKTDNLFGRDAGCMTTEQTQKCLDKLADYEDLDERGMVIRDGEPEKCFANITFDKNDLQKMVDEKVAEIELNIDRIKEETIKEETINEFVKMLHRYAFSNEYGTHIVFTPEQLDELVAHWKEGEE